MFVLGFLVAGLAVAAASFRFRATGGVALALSLLPYAGFALGVGFC